MVKKIDDYIAKAFTDLGFSTEDITNGCWLLERENKKTGEMIKVAWIVYHKFLERAAQMAGIVFDEPKIFNLTDNEIALYVNGKKGDFSAWAIGEASTGNLTATSKNYRWAMAEKRAKDRVILKLLGIAGDVYSEEEAEEFKQKPEKPSYEKEAAAEKTARTKALKAGKDIPAPKQSLDERFENTLKYLETKSSVEINSVIDRINQVVNDLYAVDRIEDAYKISNMMNEKLGLKEDSDFFDDVMSGKVEFTKPYNI